MFDNCLTKERASDQSEAYGTAQALQGPILALIDVLRTELTDYGGMLVLLDEQQQLIELRSAADLIQNVAALKQQMETIARNRSRRSELMQQVLVTLELPPGTTFRALLPALPREFELLVHALVDEINEILFRCQQRVLFNKHLLSSRLADLLPRGLDCEVQLN